MFLAIWPDIEQIQQRIKFVYASLEVQGGAFQQKSSLVTWVHIPISLCKPTYFAAKHEK